MSDFTCTVVRASIEPHPNADQIEICRVGGYQSIIKKGQFKDGELVAYIPEQAVLPEQMLKEMGFWNETQGKGMLSGGAGNRVRAIKLRKVLSQGLIVGGIEASNDSVVFARNDRDELTGENVKVIRDFKEGDDVSEFLGVVKYEPALPTHMRGRALGVDTDATHKYDFENFKKDPDMFLEGELVVITEKIHGTLLEVGVVPSSRANERYYKGRCIMTSKGLGGRGVILDHNDETNLYAQAVKKWDLFERMLAYAGKLADVHDQPVFIFGEVFGRTPSGAGIQDLTYTDVELDYRAFDICIGNRGTERFFEMTSFMVACETMGIPTVPVLYEGPYSKEVLLKHTDGPTTLIPPRGKTAHIREGVVVKSYNEDRNPRFINQRKIAKSVSEAYLLRGGDATEFN